MSTPEIVLGSSLLTLFIATNQFAFIRPRNVLPARDPHDPDRPHHVQHQLRRGHGQGPRRGLPAQPRGGRRSTSTPTSRDLFWRVTFPLILPGILAAALLAFSLSIDDFVITNFTAGQTTHVPALDLRCPEDRRAGPGNVIGSTIFLTAVAPGPRLDGAPAPIEPGQLRRPAAAHATKESRQDDRYPPDRGRGRRPTDAAAPTARPVGRAGRLEPDHRPDRRAGRGLLADHDRWAALPRLLVRASA